MPRPPKAIRDHLLEETRQRLLEAAADEFSRLGYSDANIDQISLSAGFAKGTIYNYFPSKRSLLLALIQDTAARHLEAIIQPAGEETDAAARLEGFFRAGFSFVESYPAQVQVIVSLVYGRDTELKALVYQAYEGLFAWLIQDVLQAGVSGGDFRPVDPDLFAALVMSVYLGACSQLNANGKIWLDAGQVARFVLEGMRRQESFVPER